MLISGQMGTSLHKELLPQIICIVRYLYTSVYKEGERASREL